MSQIETFRNHIVESEFGVLDVEGVHHEFVSGMHGQKLDFDKIPDGSPLYKEWIDISEGFIRENFPELPGVILGVANGTNRVSLDLGLRFKKDGVGGYPSEKDEKDSKILYLSAGVQEIIGHFQPELAVVIEDVGTTGSNSVQVAVAAKAAGAQNVEVVTTWKRREQLEKLDEAGIPYRAIIDEPLTTFTPEQCENDELGFCFRGWKFIRRGE